MPDEVLMDQFQNQAAPTQLNQGWGGLTPEQQQEYGQLQIEGLQKQAMQRHISNLNDDQLDMAILSEFNDLRNQNEQRIQKRIQADPFKATRDKNLSPGERVGSSIAHHSKIWEDEAYRKKFQDAARGKSAAYQMRTGGLGTGPLGHLRYIQDYWTSRAPFAGGWWDSRTEDQKRQMLENVASGKASQQDIDMLGMYIARDQQRAKPKGFLRDIGDIASGFPGFMIEIGASGGVYTAGRNVFQKGVIAGAQKIGGKRAGTALVTRGVGTLGGTVAGTAAAATHPAHWGMLAKAIAKENVPEWEYDPVAGGGFEIDLKEQTHSIGMRRYRGMIDGLIELWSERMGGHLVAGAAAPFKKLASALPKRHLQEVGTAVVGSALREAGKKGPGAVGRFIRKGGYHGWKEEVGEEYLGEYVRSLSFTLDQDPHMSRVTMDFIKNPMDEDARNTFWRDVGPMIASFALLGAGTSAVDAYKRRGQPIPIDKPEDTPLQRELDAAEEAIGGLAARYSGKVLDILEKTPGGEGYDKVKEQLIKDINAASSGTLSRKQAKQIKWPGSNRTLYDMLPSARERKDFADELQARIHPESVTGVDFAARLSELDQKAAKGDVRTWDTADVDTAAYEQTAQRDWDRGVTPSEAEDAAARLQDRFGDQASEAYLQEYGRLRGEMEADLQRDPDVRGIWAEGELDEDIPIAKRIEEGRAELALPVAEKIAAEPTTAQPVKIGRVGRVKKDEIKDVQEAPKEPAPVEEPVSDPGVPLSEQRTRTLATLDRMEEGLLQAEARLEDAEAGIVKTNLTIEGRAKPDGPVMMGFKDSREVVRHPQYHDDAEVERAKGIIAGGQYKINAYQREIEEAEDSIQAYSAGIDSHAEALGVGPYEGKGGRLTEEAIEKEASKLPTVPVADTSPEVLAEQPAVQEPKQPKVLIGKVGRAKVDDIAAAREAAPEPTPVAEPVEVAEPTPTVEPAAPKAAEPTAPGKGAADLVIPQKGEETVPEELKSFVAFAGIMGTGATNASQSGNKHEVTKLFDEFNKGKPLAKQFGSADWVKRLQKGKFSAVWATPEDFFREYHAVVEMLREMDLSEDSADVARLRKAMIASKVYVPADAMRPWGYLNSLVTGPLESTGPGSRKWKDFRAAYNAAIAEAPAAEVTPAAPQAAEPAPAVVEEKAVEEEAPRTSAYKGSVYTFKDGQWVKNKTGNATKSETIIAALEGRAKPVPAGATAAEVRNVAREMGIEGHEDRSLEALRTAITRKSKATPFTTKAGEPHTAYHASPHKIVGPLRPSPGNFAGEVVGIYFAHTPEEAARSAPYIDMTEESLEKNVTEWVVTPKKPLDKDSPEYKAIEQEVDKKAEAAFREKIGDKVDIDDPSLDLKTEGISSVMDDLGEGRLYQDMLTEALLDKGYDALVTVESKTVAGWTIALDPAIVTRVGEAPAARKAADPKIGAKVAKKPPVEEIVSEMDRITEEEKAREWEEKKEETAREWEEAGAAAKAAAEEAAAAEEEKKTAFLEKPREHMEGKAAPVARKAVVERPKPTGKPMPHMKGIGPPQERWFRLEDRYVTGYSITFDEHDQQRAEIVSGRVVEEDQHAVTLEDGTELERNSLESWSETVDGEPHEFPYDGGIMRMSFGFEGIAKGWEQVMDWYAGWVKTQEGRTFKKTFTPGGILGKEAHTQVIMDMGKVKADIQRMNFLTRDLGKALKASAWKSKSLSKLSPDTAVHNKRQEAMNTLLQTPPEEIAEKAKELNVPPKVAEILQGMREKVDSLSDEMVEMLRAQGESSEDFKKEFGDNLINVIMDNKGFYLTRMYKVFDQATWGDQLRKERPTVKLGDREVDLLDEFKKQLAVYDLLHRQEKYAKEMFAGRMKKHTRPGGTFAKMKAANRRLPEGERFSEEELKGEFSAVRQQEFAKAVEKAREKVKPATDAELKGTINKILSPERAKGGPFFTTMGKADVALFAARKLGRGEFHQLYRKVLGEYDDKLDAAMRTVRRMSTTLATFQAQQSLIDINDALPEEDKWFIDADREEGEFIRQLPNTAAMGPLAGKWAKLGFLQGLDQTFGRTGSVPYDMNEAGSILMYKMYAPVMGYARAAKTIYSVRTQVRNFAANASIAFSAGHLFNLRGTFADSLRSVGVNIWKGEGVMTKLGEGWIWGTTGERKVDKKLAREFVAYMNELGVLGDTAGIGEIVDMIQGSHGLSAQEFLYRGPDHEEAGKIQKGQAWVKRGLRKTSQFASGFYQAGDEYWKIKGWLDNKAMLKEAYPKGSAAAKALVKKHGTTEAGLEKLLDKEAAKRLRDQYPTYSMSPDAVRFLRWWPATGTFPTWWGEFLRTQYYEIPRQAMADIKSGNPRLAQHGYSTMSRLAFANFGLGWTIKFGMGLLWSALGYTRLDDDEEWDLRTLVPPWSKQSDLFSYKDDKGNWYYVDLTFALPHSRPLDNIKYWLKTDDPWTDQTKEILDHTFGDFYSVDMVAGKIGEIIYNQKAGGGKVFNEKDPWKLLAMAEHLSGPFTPGVLSTARRTYLGYKGHSDEFGEVYNARVELFSAIAGARVVDVDFERNLEFKVREFTENLVQDKRMAEKYGRSQARGSLAVFKRYLRYAEVARRRDFDKFQQQLDALSRGGITRKQFSIALKEGGTNLKVRTAVLNLRYSPYQMSNERRQEILETPEGPEKIAAYRAHRREQLRKNRSRTGGGKRGKMTYEDIQKQLKRE